MATSLEKRARRLGAPVSTHSHLSPTAFRFWMGFFMVVVSLFFLTTGMYSGGRSALTFFGARVATFGAGTTAFLEQVGAVLMGIVGALFLRWTWGEPHRITVRIHEAGVVYLRKMALRSRVRLLPWNEIAEVAARENGGALKATDEAVFLLPAELSGFGKAIAVIGDSVRQGRLSPEGEAAQRRLATKGRLAQAVKLVLLIALAAMVGYIWTATEALRTAP